MLARALTFLRACSALEIILFVLILGVAGWLRFVNLAFIPAGLHGDEAICGLVGQQILREGYIGPYSLMAMGQPTGPIYLTALSLHFFGSTIWAVRAVSAFLGTLTVAVLYLVLRRHGGAGSRYNRAVALLGMVFLATLNWHLHFSRIGFPVIAWPLCTLLTTWAALEAVRRRQARWWAVTGFLAGVGIYSYNAHLLCLAVWGVWLLVYLVRVRGVQWSHRCAWLLSYGVALFIVAGPMLLYALDPSHGYFEHPKTVSIFTAPGSQWHQLTSVGEKIYFLGSRYISFWRNLSWNSATDAVDGTGIVPVVPLSMLVLALVGLVLGLKAKRGPLLGLCLCYVLVLPLGPVTTLEGLNRRAFALSPFLALLAAVGVTELYRLANGVVHRMAVNRPRQRLMRAAMPVALLLVCGWGMYRSVYGYFAQVAVDQALAWTFVQEMALTCQYLQTLPPDAHVYFYSNRWSGNYETRQFLAPNVSIEDRSKEFATFSFERDRFSGRPYFVLVGVYKERLPQLKKMYPQGHIQVGPKTLAGKDAFISLWLDN